MTWQDWIRIAALVAAAVFSGLADYRSRRAIRRVEQIRARRVQGITPPGIDVGSGTRPSPTSTTTVSHGTANR